MQTAAFVALLVVGIAALQAAIWVPIIMWLRRKKATVTNQLAAHLRSETALRPPENANYRGATAPGYPGVKGNGVIALTRERLVFRFLVGKGFEIPLAEIVGLREAKLFKGSVVGGATHLILQTRSGEIGFYVKDNAAWLDAIARTREQCTPLPGSQFPHGGETTDG